MNIRLQATKYIWVAYGVTMVALFLSLVFTGASLSAGYVVIAAAASIMVFLSTGMVWNWGELHDTTATNDESAAEKIKNQAKLEQIISRLSEEERAALRDKLEDDDQYGLSDDGEIVRYKS